MTPFTPIRLHDDYIVLEPLSLDHVPALEAAAADGELWNLAVTSVPAPGQARDYVEKALQGQADGLMLPFAVREAGSGEIVGSTRYRSEEHTSELQSLMRISYAVFCLKKKKNNNNNASTT